MIPGIANTLKFSSKFSAQNVYVDVSCIESGISKYVARDNGDILRKNILVKAKICQSLGNSVREILRG